MERSHRSRIDQPEPPDIDHPDMPMPPKSPEIRPARREHEIDTPADPGIDLPEPPEVDEPDRREREEHPEPEKPGAPGE